MRTRLESFESLVFYALIFLLPVQLRIALGGFTGGAFHEYTWGFVYATDFLLLALLILWGLSTIKGVRTGSISRSTNKRPRLDRYIGIAVFIFAMVAALSITQAVVPMLGLYKFARLALVVLLLFYIRDRHHLYSFAQIATVLAMSGVLQATIAIGQGIMQHDLGLRLFGESPLSPSTPGVAKIDLSDGKLIRSYGTFPHPNVLAAFLLPAIWSAYYFVLTKARGSVVPWMILIAIMVLGLLSTYSRVAIGVWALGSIVLLAAGNQRSRMMVLGGMLIGLVFGFALINPGLTSRVAITEVTDAINIRSEYTAVGIAALESSPVLGVGIGNFVPYFQERYASFDYPLWVFQPAHNVYVMIMAELGLAGLVALIGLLLLLAFRAYMLLRKGARPESLIIIVTFGAFLVLAFFDHYFWTLHQGQLLLWLMLGLL